MVPQLNVFSDSVNNYSHSTLYFTTIILKLNRPKLQIIRLLLINQLVTNITEHDQSYNLY